MTDYAVFETRLRELRDEMTSRIDAIDKDVRHREEPVEKDFAEQVTQGENDDVLKSLDNEARVVVQQIDAALLRIRDGTYGLCRVCGEPIARERLEAVPYTATCIDCAEQASAERGRA
ncbi:MAG TPA: TraR/DksA family transcriptional regulator [Gammaproteobacteria bacterium]|nr:TraR/DksA family transcriptional regulator [Gammaproteobacteria bacterium]